MEKVDIGTQGFLYPMPMTLIGSVVDGKPTFMPVAWVNRARFNPPWLIASMNKNHVTNRGIHEHAEFSVNIPSRDLVAAVDHCGLVSAAKTDKSGVFHVFHGQLEHAPLIAECPLCLECRLVRIVDLESHDLFVGEVVGSWTEERFLDDRGKPDLAAMAPFALTMTDNRYWAIGEPIADAWSVGRTYEPPEAEATDASAS